MLRRPDRKPDTSKPLPSAAALWPPLRPFIAGEYRLGRFMARRRWTSVLYFALAGGLFFGTRVYFRVWRGHLSMPLLLGLALVSLFIWFSENIGTFTKAWLYPSQRHGWSMVSVDKFGSWFLLLIISYTLVSMVNAPRDRRRDANAARCPVSRSCAHGSSPSAAG